ncbi:hypothetical protein ASPBRDRAFT_408437 [Aspergillus brasiliensis CBS 101740]|uniref:Uncharacterized protein n=1 Tax=Aspergillus brasiliensis (strain CBS 101740 / IMI 381727 / IBT 21946) TaxID=767769 RepID=A0A1L9UXH4_ASPBC|nr:hypothetical protein ASPBRDRAFT_408437 [Aspergillus brasiliensis CBS 101740]
MANGWSLIIGLIFVVVASVLAWIFSPKGENQTCVLYLDFPVFPRTLKRYMEC